MGILERKEREKEQRRNDIIDAAEEVFFEKGLNNSTMNEVSKEAELSKGTLYLYFKSKEEIYFEIKTRAINILMKMFKDSISANKNGFENCLGIGKTYLNFVKKHSNYFKTIIYFETKDCISCEDSYKEDNPLKISAQTISQGIEDGSIRNDIPAIVLAQVIWAQTNGVLQYISTKQKILELTDVKAEDIIESQFEVIKKGIKNEG